MHLKKKSHENLAVERGDLHVTRCRVPKLASPSSKQDEEWKKDLEESVHFSDESGKYAALEKRIRESVVKNCWVSEKGMFAETPKKEQFSQHTNIMAILTDAIPVSKQQAMMEKILSDKSLIQTTIYYKFYLFNALHKVGLGDRYTSLLENWTNQLELGLTTFAETDIEPRSECHAWSASPNYHFLKIIAGIYPAGKHFNEIVIAPHFGDLTTINASMPHPNGDIAVRLSKKNNQVSGEVILPQGTTGVFKWQGNEIKLKAGKYMLEVTGKNKVNK